MCVNLKGRVVKENKKKINITQMRLAGWQECGMYEKRAILTSTQSLIKIEKHERIYHNIN